MNTLYQLTLKQVSSSTLPVSPLPEDVAQDVMRIRYSKVMEELYHKVCLTEEWLDDYYSTDGDGSFKDTREYRLKGLHQYLSGLFHDGDDWLDIRFNTSLQDIQAMIWELLGLKCPRGKISKKKRAKLARNPLFKIYMREVLSYDEHTRLCMYRDYFVSQLP